MELNKICLQVSEFNYLFGVINYNYDPLNTDVFNYLFNNKDEKFDSNQVELRYKLIQEESNELIEAFEKLDVIEIIDALCDILYVVAGAKVYFNLSNESINSVFLDNNYDNIILQNKELDYQKTIDIKEIILSNKDDTEDIAKIQERNIILEDLTKNMLFGNFFSKEEIETYNEILDKIIEIVYKFSIMIEINIFQLFELVHISNMTKVCTDKQTAIVTVEWYKATQDRYKSPNFKEINYNNKIYWIIFDDETKKILKSIKYSPVKFFN